MKTTVDLLDRFKSIVRDEFRGDWDRALLEFFSRLPDSELRAQLGSSDPRAALSEFKSKFGDNYEVGAMNMIMGLPVRNIGKSFASMTESEIREIVREELLREGFAQQLKNYNVDEPLLDELYGRLHEAGVDVEDDGRFMFLRKGDVTARVTAVDANERGELRIKFVPGSMEMRGVLNTEQEVSAPNPESAAKRISGIMDKHSYA